MVWWFLASSFLALTGAYVAHRGRDRPSEERVRLRSGQAAAMVLLCLAVLAAMKGAYDLGYRQGVDVTERGARAAASQTVP